MELIKPWQCPRIAASILKNVNNFQKDFSSKFAPTLDLLKKEFKLQKEIDLKTGFRICDQVIAEKYSNPKS